MGPSVFPIVITTIFLARASLLIVALVLEFVETIDIEMRGAPGGR